MSPKGKGNSRDILDDQKDISDQEIVIVGRIGAPHGIKGWVHVQSFTEPPENLLNYRHWYLKIRNQWLLETIEVLEIRPQGDHFAALLAGYSDRDQAALVTNAEVGIERISLPKLESGRYYWNDLIGMQVFTESGEYLGIVSSLFETGSNDVLVVKRDFERDSQKDSGKDSEKISDTREHLIPFILDEYIKDVDLKSRVIRVSWDPEFF